jgi:anti-sigma-K factor RskA
MSQLDPDALEARLSGIASDMTDEDRVLHDPPADLWGRISAAVDAERPTAPVVTLDSRRSPWVKVVSIAAAVVVIAGIGAVILNRGGTVRPTSEVVATATLARLAGTQGEASAKLVRTGSSVHLHLTTADMANPPAGTEYELWLMDSTITTPHSLGQLRGKVTGHNQIDVVVPPDVDPRKYPVVDISVEPESTVGTYSGHSVMRGTLA